MKKKNLFQMCLIGVSEKGFSKENFNEMSNFLKNDNSQDKDFQKFQKKEVIKIINKLMKQN